MSPRLMRLSAALVALAWLPLTARAQVLINGDFESGSLAGWTVGGTGAAAAVRASHFTGGTPAVPDGTWFGLLSTGPDNRGGAAQLYDGNTTNDYDFVSLSQTVVVPFAPAVVAFDWNFPSSEQDQGDTYDDLFDLRMARNGGALTQIYSGSSCKNNGSNYSNFPSAPCTGLGQTNWTLNATSPASVRNTTLRFGVGAWRHACVPLTGVVAGDSVTLRFAALDQRDANYDSALLLDGVQIRQSCDTTTSETLRQLTATSGAAVELKNGTVEYRPVSNGPLAADATGLVLAFVSSANLTGDNPNAIEQVFAWNGSAYTRATGLTVASGGDVQGVAMSSDGRYVAIAARPGPPATSPWHIYRWDRTAATVTTVTAAYTAPGCKNENPSISDNGARIAWESECSAITGSGSARKIVYSTFASGSWGTPTLPSGSASGSCIARNPRWQRDGASGRYLALESSCNLASNNADGNVEIFRYDTNGSDTWRQVTTTAVTRTCSGGSGSETILNFRPTLDSSGRYLLFVSNAQLVGSSNALCDSYQVFSYDANGSGTLTQLTTAAITAPRYLDVSLNANGNDYAYERLNTSTGFSEIGRRQRTTAATDVQVFQGVLGATNVLIGLDGTTPVLDFLAADDPLGSNADFNFEVFYARGP